MFLPKQEAIEKITEAILAKKVLLVRYKHVAIDDHVVERRKAPFDIGTTNPKKIEAHKNNAYMFCCDHIDEKTGCKKPIVHSINIEHIISINETGEFFNENELADINFRNTNPSYDYRDCQFAVAPERNWFN